MDWKRLEEVKKRFDGASLQPWYVDEGIVYDQSGNDVCEVLSVDVAAVAEFIANAPEDIEWLLSVASARGGK
jgi:hypothetical protein